MADRYTKTAVVLHWFIALLIFAAFPLGLYMHDLPLSPTKLRLYSYHKWIGVTVFLFALIRVFWLINAPSAAPAGDACGTGKRSPPKAHITCFMH